MAKEVMAVPYLEGRWTLPGAEDLELAPAGLWIPEIDREAWITRGEGLTGRMYWERAQPVSHAELSNFTISSGDQQRYAEVIGRDAASIQRDGFFYSNFLEQLKHAMDDATADLVVTRMQDLGFESPKWPQAIGGPPPHESPHPWEANLELAPKAHRTRG
jgi:hypothetical protein